jgi:alanyl-tRNA synthetase
MFSEEIRQKYIDFFISKGHVEIPSASIIPENDPTVLFTTAGMQPLVPYLLGQSHPAGRRITNIQKCIRTGDIEEVGDNTHCTFFEMLGNWSLGDYFKKEAIQWSWEFLTSEKWLNLSKDILYFTVFEGDEDAPRDMESYQYWLDLGVPADHLFFLPKKENWWGPAGETGPCGPDTEMFIDTGKEFCSAGCNPSCDCGKFIEFWNNVFMEYNKTSNGGFIPLSQKNVDTGMGLERILVTLNGGSVFDTDLFSGIMIKLEELSNKSRNENVEIRKAFRIVADHIRTAVFILGDPNGVSPSNMDQGYVLRRLLRRAIRFSMQLDISEGGLKELTEVVVTKYKNFYPELEANKLKIMAEIDLEESRFIKTLANGLKEFEKVLRIMKQEGIELMKGTDAFHLYDTYGFPIEITVEMAAERGLHVDMEGYKANFDKHRELSQVGASQRFKGGLADNQEQTTQLHTATHLLHQALRQVLGEDVEQKGSNITTERLRFDFSFSRKMTEDEIKRTEELVNEIIDKNLEVSVKEMSLEKAREEGAIGLFESRYENRVKVYTIGQFSKEICGGPHVNNTAELVKFKIVKEESSSSGVRRIKAVLLK